MIKPNYTKHHSSSRIDFRVFSKIKGIWFIVTSKFQQQNTTGTTVDSDGSLRKIWPKKIRYSDKGFK
jgi:hypothetical protein